MAITFDTGSRGWSEASTRITGSHTISGQDRYIVIALLNREPSNVLTTGVVFNNVSMSLIWDQNHSPDARIRLYGLANPALGTGGFTASVDGTTNLSYIGASYNGVHQTNPTGSFSSGSGHDFVTSFTSSYSSSVGALVIGVACAGVTTFTEGAGQSTRGTISTGQANSCGIVSDEPGAPIVTIEHLASDARISALAGFSLMPAGGPPELTLTLIRLTDNLGLTPLIVNNGRGSGIILRGQ